jgi:hypothetical protein
MDKRKKIIIHIGLPKAATTTLQKSIGKNISLLNQHNVYYPKAGCGRNTNAHHNLGFQVNNDPRHEPKKGDLASLGKEIEKAHQNTILLSSEHFCRTSPSGILLLKETLQEFGDTFILVYLRRQDLWLNSWWTHLVKLGYLQTNFKEFCESVFNKHPISGNDQVAKDIAKFVNPDFLDLLHHWERIFSKENILIRVLEGSQIGNNVFHDFLYTIGLKDLQGFEISEPKNISPSPKTLETIRYLTKIIGRSAIPRGQNFSAKIVDLAGTFAINNNWNTKSFNAVDQAMYEKIMNKYAESNSKIAQAYFGRDQLFLDPYFEKNLTHFDVSELDPLEMLNLAGFLLKAVQTKKIFARILNDQHSINGDARDNQLLQIQALRKQNEQLKGQIQEIRNTRGWRVLETLRRLYGPLYRFLNRKEIV